VQRAEKPISDPAKRYEFPGFSVLPPQGARWFVSPAGPVEPLPAANLLLTPQSPLVVFARRPQQPITKDPRSMHRALLSVGTRDLATNTIVARQSLGGVAGALFPGFVSPAPGAAALGEGVS